MTTDTRPLLVFAGVATEDSIAVVERYPGADERVIADEVSFGGGGPAATAAVAAARLGMRTAVIASVGEDDAADVVRRRLAEEGVDVSGIRTAPGAKTSRSVVVISGAERHRAIVNQPGPALDLDDPAARALLAEAAWVHVDQHGWAPVDAHRRAQGGDWRLSIDGGNRIEGLRLDGVDLYAPTVEALQERLPGAAGIEELLRGALAEGAERVFVTDGGSGSYGLTAADDLVHVTPPRSPIISTLGAGDVFHGALLAAHVHSANGAIAPGLAAIAAYATTVATLSCRAVDGRSGIPDHDETLAHLAPEHRP